MFLHTLVFKANSTALLENMDRFLATCAALNISAGFVFFDDCWSHAGANASVQCVPTPGVHNGCWQASPQDVERTSVADFRDYVESVVSRFQADPRVRWWEM